MKDECFSRPKNIDNCTIHSHVQLEIERIRIGVASCEKGRNKYERLNEANKTKWKKQVISGREEVG